MYIVIEENRIVTANTLSMLNRKMSSLLEEDEFTVIGGDRIVKLTNQDIDFVMDKRKLSTIMFGNFFKKDPLPRNLMIANLVFAFIILTRVMGMS